MVIYYLLLSEKFCINMGRNISSYVVGFEVLTAVRTKMAVFWVVAACCLVVVLQSLSGPCCLHRQGDETLVNVYHTTRRYNPEDSHLSYVVIR
jgi:hypothetical protein